MPSALPRIAFICTGNAGRSQIAAALARVALGGKAEVVSAGVAPWPHLHCMTAPTLARRHIVVQNERPKPVSEVAGGGLSLVVSIGDPAYAKLPRTLPGQPLWVHWDITDPADADGTPDSAAAFEQAARQIEQRLPEVLALLPELAAPPHAADAPIRFLYRG